MLNPIFSPKVSLRNAVLVLASALTCGSAFAQWLWIDNAGRKVFSDTAPPQGIPEKNILKRPGAASRTPSAPAEPEAKAPEAAKPAGLDPKLEAKRKEAEMQEAAKRKEADAQLAQARAANCTRAKAAKGTLELGTRIQTANAQGERVYMDDSARAAELKRVNGIIATDCSPMASSSQPDS